MILIYKPIKMASTSLKKNIVAIVQARCNSIRLPNKIMKKLQECLQ